MGLFAGGVHSRPARNRLFAKRDPGRSGGCDRTLFLPRVLQQPLCRLGQGKSHFAMACDLGSDGRLFADRSGPVVVPLDKPGSSQGQASLDELTMESDWEIKSRAHCCARTGKQFGQGEYFYTLLFREREGFRREDISEEAWANRNE